MARRLASQAGGLEVLTLRGPEVRAYRLALEAAQSAGLPLDVLAREAAGAMDSSGVGLPELARFWTAQRGTVEPITVGDAVAAFLASRLEVTRHRQDLASRLGRLVGRAGQRLVTEVSRADLQRWLDGIPGSVKTGQHYRGAVVQLWNWLQGRGYLPEGPHAASRLVLALSGRTSRPQSKEVFGPDELDALLSASAGEPTVLCGMAIQALAGLRYEELCPELASDLHRLEWRDVLFEEKMIHVRAEVAKVGDGRFVPICRRLEVLLRPHAGSGPVFPGRKLVNGYRRAARRAGLRWKHNGLRHGYGSFRAALTRNVAQVADEMGNSPAVVRRHYRTPYPDDMARQWFGE